MDNYPMTDQGLLGNNMFVYCGNNPILRADTGGKFWHIVAGAVFGAVVGMATQIITNVATGQTEDIFDGVLGAALGGAAYNVVSMTTGNVALASIASSAIEATTNEVVCYATGEKELTMENVTNSVGEVATTIGRNAITACVTGTVANKLVKINSGWFKPKKAISSFTGKYAKKVLKQTAVQGALTAGYNITKAWSSKVYDYNIAMPWQKAPTPVNKTAMPWL